MALKITNNATSLLASSINTGSTSVVITSGDEGRFPTLGGGDWCPVTVVDGAGNLEIMRCTARAGVTLTVTRAQEGTTAKNFSAGARVDVRLTAAALAALDLSLFTGKLPIASGGTNAQTAVEAKDNLSTISGAIASAATTDLSTANVNITGDIVPISGAANITSFGVEQAGARRLLKFTGTATLKYNVTSMILPTGADIVAQAGDSAEVHSLGGGNWNVTSYYRANGKPLVAAFPLTTVDNTIYRADGVTGGVQPSGIVIDDTNKMSGGTLDQMTLVFKQSAAPTPTAEGDAQWDTDDNVVVVGDGSGQQIFVPLPAGTAAGDLLYLSGAKVYTRLPKGTAGQLLVMNPGATAPSWVTPVLSKSFESAQLTITSGGTLSVPHGLGVKPPIYLAFIQCVSAEGGYAPPDEEPIAIGIHEGSTGRGLSVVPDATNLVIRMGQQSNSAFQVIRKDTGAVFSITNANWKLVLRALA